MYVKRDSAGRIESVSRIATEQIGERIEDGDPEVIHFLRGDSLDQQAALRASDLEVIRVLEDLVEVLIARGVIHFTDLPDAAQNKLLGRKSLRQSGGFTLPDEDDALL
jgi:hypothetical protein